MQPVDYMTPFGMNIDLIEGIMADPAVSLTRRASDMRGHYADEAALEKLIAEQDDPVHYEVFEGNVPEECGHLRFGISKLYPGRIGDECFMTKGHYHTVAETAEVYMCIAGQGYLLMKTAEGQSMHESMVRNRLVYVPPYWAHRSINTGDSPLISLFIYPGDAGHNYGDIEEEGFPKRVFIRDGREVIE